MEQSDRVEQMKSFLGAEKGVLIATDVAARGLDLPNVESIIQFSPPGSARDYVQRIGRTARKGHSGQSILFLLPSEGKNFVINNNSSARNIMHNSINPPVKT